MAEKPVHIYAATCAESGKVYVGITTDLQRRKRRHKLDATDGYPYAFYRAIRKYGWESFTWELLETCDTRDFANEREILWIKRFNSQVPNGYNSTQGGDTGRHGQTVSEETRRKLSEAGKGRVFTEEHRRNLSIAQKAKAPASEETRRRISEANKGKVISEETRRKMVVSAGRGEDHCMAKLKNEQILEIRERGESGESLRSIALSYGVSYSAIDDIIKRKTWSHIE